MALPEGDDAALEDLELLVGYAVHCGKDAEHLIDTWAPWGSKVESDRIIKSAHRFPVWHGDDELARLIGLTYAVRQALGITSVTSIDVDLAGCKRLRRERGKAKKRHERAAARAKKQETEINMQTESAAGLSRRQQAVFEMVDGEIAAPRILEQLARHKAFRGIAAASLRPELHRVLNQLIELGKLKDDYQPGPKGMPVRYVQRRQQ